MRNYVWKDLSEAERTRVLTRPALAGVAGLEQRVGEIIAAVRAGGDDALRELAERFDGVRLDALRVDASELEAAAGRLSSDARRAIEAAAANIETFHAAQLPVPLDIETAPGVRCERLTRPIQRVGLYVPAGSAPLPSTALMLGIPSRLAGCPVRVLCSPPQADGRVDAAVLFAARIGGIEDVFRIGGAQAIAAMAYGTESVPKVAKIFGPGNAWVTEAKAQVSRDPEGAALDYPAGPSEVLVIADADADPAFVAADLLSQAEHGPDSQVLLVTDSPALAAAVAAEVADQKRALSRLSTIDAALGNSSVIVVDDIDQAIAVSNRYAPEHLILQLVDARAWLDRVVAAGSVFLGRWAPESVGDYCSGTNHVLPTYGYAHCYSSLGLGDFLRSMTVQELSPDGLSAIGPVATALADLEGLDAHAEAVRRRLARIDAGRQP